MAAYDGAGGMNEALGEILPLAVGVAVSPVPIIAAILMLLSPAAGRTGSAFLVGWLVGIGVAVALATLLGDLVPAGEDDGSRPAAAVVQLVLGLGLLALAVRQWRGRPSGDEEPELPAWMAGIDTITAGKALGLGVALAALNPKNLLLAVSAGVTVAQAALGTSAVVVLAIWVLLAASTVMVPVVTALVVPSKVAGPLDRLRAWLAANNATVMSVLLLVIGVNLLGKALGSV